MSSIGLGTGETQPDRTVATGDDDGFLSRVGGAAEDIVVGTVEGVGDVIASGFKSVAEFLPIWASSVFEQQQEDQLDEDTRPTENERRRRTSDLNGRLPFGITADAALIGIGGLLALVALVVLIVRR